MSALDAEDSIQISRYTIGSYMLSLTHCCIFLMHSCATGDWHVGAKRVFELFPGSLKARSRAERKKRFSKLQRQAVTAAAAHAASAAQDAPVSSPLPSSRGSMCLTTECLLSVLCL